MEKRELLKKIERVLQQPLPEEIRKAVNEIYINYNDAYRSLLSKVERAIGNDEKLMTELNHIASYMKKDYEEEQQVSNELEEMSYSIRIERMLDNVIGSVKRGLDEEQIENSKQELGAIIDVEESENPEERKKEEIERCMQGTLENKKCAKEIVESVLLEINSSQKMLLLKLSTIEKKLPDKAWMQSSQKKFKEEIETISKEAKTNTTIKIEQILNGQNKIMANQILELYEQYQKEGKQLTGREKFVTALHVDVNPQEAVKKVEEERRTIEMQKEKIQNEELPGNAIE